LCCSTHLSTFILPGWVQGIGGLGKQLVSCNLQKYKHLSYVVTGSKTCVTG
jgi:hypothetical protein